MQVFGIQFLQLYSLFSWEFLLRTLQEYDDKSRLSKNIIFQNNIAIPLINQLLQNSTRNVREGLILKIKDRSNSEKITKLLGVTPSCTHPLKNRQK